MSASDVFPKYADTSGGGIEAIFRSICLSAPLKSRHRSADEQTGSGARGIYEIHPSLEKLNHEFEKARFYSKEEKKERENLRALMESYKINENATVPVTIDDIEAVIAQWTGATLDVIRKARQQTEEKNPPTA